MTSPLSLLGTLGRIPRDVRRILYARYRLAGKMAQMSSAFRDDTESTLDAREWVTQPIHHSEVILLLTRVMDALSVKGSMGRVRYEMGVLGVRHMTYRSSGPASLTDLTDDADEECQRLGDEDVGVLYEHVNVTPLHVYRHTEGMLCLEDVRHRRFRLWRTRDDHSGITRTWYDGKRHIVEAWASLYTISSWLRSLGDAELLLDTHHMRWILDRRLGALRRSDERWYATRYLQDTRRRVLYLVESVLADKDAYLCALARINLLVATMTGRTTSAYLKAGEGLLPGSSWTFQAAEELRRRLVAWAEAIRKA
jgi:hypothetical protein